MVHYAGFAETVDRTKYLSESEVKQLRSSTEAHALQDIKYGRLSGLRRWMLVDLALSTGLRVSEIWRLKISDVDLRRGSLSITRSKKKRKKVETLAISKELKKHLKKYITYMVVDSRLRDNETGKLFKSKSKKGLMTTQCLQLMWKAAVKRAGLPRSITIHCARHTLAVHLLKKTKNLRLVQKQLGHASPVITAALYADVSFEDMQESLNNLY